MCVPTHVNTHNSGLWKTGKAGTGFSFIAQLRRHFRHHPCRAYRPDPTPCPVSFPWSLTWLHLCRRDVCALPTGVDKMASKDPSKSETLWSYHSFVGISFPFSFPHTLLLRDTPVWHTEEGAGNLESAGSTFKSLLCQCTCCVTLSPWCHQGSERPSSLAVKGKSWPPPCQGTVAISSGEWDWHWVRSNPCLFFF